MDDTSPLNEFVPNQIWTQERSLWFGGVRLRSRTTIVRLSDGGLWVHSPAAPTDAVCRGLDALGEVKWIVVPNQFHHLNAPAMKQRYPRASVMAPASVRTRNAAVTIDRDLAETDVVDFRRVRLDGVPFLDETTFFHEPTQTLIGADLMMCGCKKDHWSWRWVSRAFGQYERFKLPPDVWMKTKPSPVLAQALKTMLALPLKRILVAHSDPIEERPAEQLAQAWHFALKAKSA